MPEYENLKYDYFETYYSSIIKKYDQNFINIKNLIEKLDKDEIFYYHTIIIILDIQIY